MKNLKDVNWLRLVLIFSLLLIFACTQGAYYNGQNGNYGNPDQLIGDQLYRALDKLTNQMVEDIESQNKTTLAVIEFSNLNGTVSGFGRFLAEKLISQLFETRRFKIIERNLLNRVIDEYKLSQSGVTSPEMAEKLGQLLGVEAIITGTVTDMGGGFDVNARIIDTSTGGLMAASSVIVAKDDLVMRLLQMDYTSPWQPPDTQPDDNFISIPTGAFASAIEVDTKVLIKLGPVYEAARKEFDIKLSGNRLIWKNVGSGKHMAYVHTNGKIIILSREPLSSQEDMNSFRDTYVRIAEYIIRVNVDMNKDVRNHAWRNNLTVYNYERNTYKRIMGYLRGSAILRMPQLNLKQSTLFVYADGWNNRVYFDSEKIARWSGKGSKTMDVTHYMYYGDHTFEIKQYGGTRPFFVFEFFVESNNQSIQITNNKDTSFQDSVPCYAISELRLPN